MFREFHSNIAYFQEYLSHESTLVMSVRYCRFFLLMRVLFFSKFCKLFSVKFFIIIVPTTYLYNYFSWNSSDFGQFPQKQVGRLFEIFVPKFYFILIHPEKIRLVEHVKPTCNHCSIHLQKHNTSIKNKYRRF